MSKSHFIGPALTLLAGSTALALNFLDTSLDTLAWSAAAFFVVVGVWSTWQAWRASALAEEARATDQESDAGKHDALIDVARKCRGFIVDNATLVSRFTAVVTSGDSLSGQVAQARKASGDMVEGGESLAQSASQVMTQVRGAHELAEQGSAQVQSAVAAVNQVAEVMDDTAREFRSVVGNAESIGSMVETIQGIAAQTNLLALNAAIEAARAGDAGRGFAVVADEVRKLAERTASATVEIQTKIESIVACTRSMDHQLETSREAVQSAVSQASSTAQTITQIQGHSAHAVEAAEAIVDAAARQLASGEKLKVESEGAAECTERLGGAVADCNRVLRQLVQLAEEVKDTVDDLGTSIHPVERLLDGIEEIRASNVLVMNSRDKSEAERSIARARAIDQRNELLWREYQVSNFSGGDVWPSYEEWRACWRRAQEAALGGDFAKVRSVIPQQVRPAYDKLKACLDPLIHAAGVPA